MTNTADIAKTRALLVLSGALAGLALWVLVDVLDDVTGSDRLILAFGVFIAGLFAPLLTMIGPLPPARAFLGAVMIGLLASFLITTASFRFDVVQPFLNTGHPLFALLLIIALPLPYIVAGLSGEGGWLSYPKLFDAAWNILVRAVAALLFLGAFWAVVFLSGALLGLVGVDIIKWLIEIPPVPFIASGVVLGLGAAVAFELSDYVSPQLPLRLLRLLLPVVVVVTAIFLAALPFRGLSGLFGTLSVASTLIAMAFAAATLVSTAIDRDEDAAVQGKLMRLSAGALALMLPVLGFLAVYSVAERVSEYGWSPDRLAAMTAAVVMAGYGVAYGASVLLQREWMARIRQMNAFIALGVLALALAWLSPLINPQRLSVQSQVARYSQGLVTADALDLWSIAREWGRPGAAAIATLAALPTEDADILEERIASLNSAQSRHGFESAVPPARVQSVASDLGAVLALLPNGAALPNGLLEGQTMDMLELWRAACDRTTPGGNRGCIAVMADLAPESAGDEVLLFIMMSDQYVQTWAFGQDGNAVGRFGPTWVAEDPELITSPELIDRIVSKTFAITPSRRNAFTVGGSELILLP